MENKEIIKNLNSTDPNIVFETLNFISKEGNKEIVIHLIKLLKATKIDKIRNEVIRILENLKLQNCSESIVDAINDKEFKNELDILVPACWKNGLNYESYIETFVDVFINSDFMLAFEALTVIDTFEEVNIEKAELCLLKLDSQIEDSKDDKKALIYQLIGIINDLKENPAA